jgi:hypothetical protein
MVSTPQRDYASADIGAADIDREDGVVALEHPRRHQLHRADQAGCIGIAVRRDESDIDSLGFQDHAGAPDRHLADPAGAKSASNHNALGIAPALKLEVTADDQGKFLGEVLDRALQHAGSLQVTVGQQGVERLFADILAGLVAERVLAILAQWFAPVFEDFAKRALGDAVAEKSLVILRFQVVAVDLDRRQAWAAVDWQIGQRRGLVGHGAPPSAFR